jgi:hypothetical protein
MKFVNQKLFENKSTLELIALFPLKKEELG